MRKRAGDWARLVDDWKRSGVDAETFAERRGVRASTLTWWRWRLGNVVAPPTGDGVRLVRVDVSSDSDAASIAAEGWELVTAAGALRVDGPLRGAELSLVVAALVGAQTRAR